MALRRRSGGRGHAQAGWYLSAAARRVRDDGGGGRSSLRAYRRWLCRALTKACLNVAAALWCRSGASPASPFWRTASLAPVARRQNGVSGRGVCIMSCVPAKRRAYACVQRHNICVTCRTVAPGWVMYSSFRNCLSQHHLHGDAARRAVALPAPKTTRWPPSAGRCGGRQRRCCTSPSLGGRGGAGRDHLYRAAAGAAPLATVAAAFPLCLTARTTQTPGAALCL